MSFKKSFIFLGATAFLFAAFIPFVAAQDQKDGGNGLQISPTRSEVSILPGEQKQFSIDIKNITNGELEARPTINDFESDGATGIPQIIVDTSERTPTTIDKFIKGLGNLTLAPGESKRVNLTVDVPADATPGAYFGAVRYSAIPKGGILSEEADRQLALTASVAHLVFVEISGDITEQIQIEKLVVGRDAKGDNKEIKNGSIFLNSPNRSSLGIRNLGNGFARPFGTVNIKNMFGKEVFKYDVNETNPKGIVLPKSSRVFTNNIENIKTPGRYTAVAAVAYGNGGEVITYKSTFWYLPVWVLLTVVAILVVIGSGIYLVYRKKYSSKSGRKNKK